jgi:hypothetical protein
MSKYQTERAAFMRKVEALAEEYKMTAILYVSRDAEDETGAGLLIHGADVFDMAELVKRITDEYPLALNLVKFAASMTQPEERKAHD